MQRSCICNASTVQYCEIHLDKAVEDKMKKYPRKVVSKKSKRKKVRDTSWKEIPDFGLSDKPIDNWWHNE